MGVHVRQYWEEISIATIAICHIRSATMPPTGIAHIFPDFATLVIYYALTETSQRSLCLQKLITSITVVQSKTLYRTFNTNSNYFSNS